MYRVWNFVTNYSLFLIGGAALLCFLGVGGRLEPYRPCCFDLHQPYPFRQFDMDQGLHRPKTRFEIIRNTPEGFRVATGGR